VSDDLLAALYAWAFAAPLWLLFWAVWSGRLRWLNDNLFGPFAVSFLPALAATVTLMGLSFATGLTLLFWVAPVVLVAGMVLWFVAALRDPVWLQPAWYREQLAAGSDTRGRGAELVGGVAQRPRAPAGSGEVRFERAAVLLTDDPDRPASVTVRHGRLGHLFVTDDVVVFVQNEVETSLRGEFGPAEIALDAVRSVRATAPERSLGNAGRMLRGDVRGRRFGRLLLLELDEGVVEFHLRGVDEAVAAIGAGRAHRTP
jgi:hypothetical protein